MTIADCLRRMAARALLGLAGAALRTLDRVWPTEPNWEALTGTVSAGERDDD